MKRKGIALLLAVALMLPVNGLYVCAEDVSDTASAASESMIGTDDASADIKDADATSDISEGENAGADAQVIDETSDLNSDMEIDIEAEEGEDSEDPQEPEETTVGVSYLANMYQTGWQSAVVDGETAGASGKRLEAFKVSLTGTEGKDLELAYKAYVYTQGWQSEVKAGAIAGTVGKNLGLQAITIDLTGEDAEDYDIYYRVSTKGFGWLDWAKNGEKAGSSSSYVYRIEQMQIKIVPAGADAPGSTTCAFIDMPTWYTRTYQYSYSWNDWSKNTTVNGHYGTNKRIEALEAYVTGAADLNLSYCVYRQTSKWTEVSSAGATAGTPGASSSERISAVKFKLTGEASQYFDVYYRVYMPVYGWTDWAKNGATAGSSGLGANIQAVQVRIRAIGKGAPGSTSTPFYSSSNKAVKVAYNCKGNLKKVFNWCAGLTYYRPTPKPTSGSHVEFYSNYGFTNNKGNCYVMAATFCKMARLLGYSCYLVEGYVPKRGGGITVHGWTEIIVNGTTYVCDPNFTNETGKNGYMIRYKQSGTWVYQKYSRVS